MDGFELINFEDIDDNIKFTKTIIEYFKNDYLIIVDFLKEDSAWDYNIMMLFKCDKEELFEYKAKMVDNIIDVYTTVVMSTIQKQTEVAEDFYSVDGPYINHINNKEMPTSILFEDDFCAIQMLRYFISVINYKYDLKIDTYNTFKYDILEILNIYEELAHKIGIDRYKIDIDENKYLIFFKYLYRNVLNYINNCFRNDKEKEMFINYLFSISFAYIKNLELYDDEYSEEDEMFIEIMTNDDNLFDTFYNNQSIGTYVIELLFQCYLEYQLGYDIRKNVKDEDIQELFEELDENYNTTYDNDVIINTYDLDIKLKCILDNLYINFSIEELYNVLLNNITLYNFILEQKLDARYSEYYKKQLIIKIIVDVFEYEIYRKKLDKDYHQIHFYNISNLKNNDKAILEYFIDNGYSLLELYYEYHNEIVTYQEKARLEVINSNNIKVVNKLSNFSIFNYMFLLSNNFKILESVDYLNTLLDKIRQVVNTNNIDILIDEDINMLINTISMNIYTNILSSDNIEEEYKIFLNIIENNDIVEYVDKNKNYLLVLCKLFIKFNKDYLSYIKENKSRKKIKEPEKIKILTKLNKFNE